VVGNGERRRVEQLLVVGAVGLALVGSEAVQAEREERAGKGILKWLTKEKLYIYWKPFKRFLSSECSCVSLQCFLRK
jgi:hypothetical protein